MQQQVNCIEQQRGNAVGDFGVSEQVHQLGIPYRCHSRNHGFAACISSCLRFAVSRSGTPGRRGSGRAKMCSSHSISKIVFSASMPFRFLMPRAEV